MISPKPLPVRIDSWKVPTRPKPNLNHPAYRPKRKPVTIAIGFAYDSGLLFCSDTKVTGAIQEFQSKLQHFTSDDGNCSVTFALSGDDLNFPIAAVSKCWDFVRRMDFASCSIEGVHNSAEFSLAEFYRDHIFPHPDRTPDTFFLEVLVGIWLRGERRLYISHETLLNAVEQYECVGAGAYLAKYLIGQYLKANPGAYSLQDTALIARHAVQSAIDYDGKCGGKPELLIVRDNGEMVKDDSSIGYPQEKMIQGIAEVTWKLVHDLAHMDDHWMKADSRIDEVSKEIRKLDMLKWDF